MYINTSAFPLLWQGNYIILKCFSLRFAVDLQSLSLLTSSEFPQLDIFFVLPTFDISELLKVKNKKSGKNELPKIPMEISDDDYQGQPPVRK